MRSLTVRLVAVNLLLVFGPAWFLSDYAIRSFDRFTRTYQEREMARLARAVAALLGGGRPGAGEEVGTLIRDWARDRESRILVVDPALRVDLDLGRHEAEPDIPLGDRRELARALGGQYGAAWIMTPDRRYVFFRVAVPVLRDGEVVGAASVVEHTGAITRALVTMKHDQRRARWISLSLAAGVTVLVSWTMTRRLGRLARDARAYAEGAPAFRTSVRGHDEIGRLAASIGHMADELARRNVYHRDFVRTAAHELRAPVTAIRAAAELLEQGAADDPEARARFLGHIAHQAERMNRITHALQNLTRIDAEATEAPRTRVEYGAWLRETVERLRLGHEDGVEVRVEGEGAWPVTLHPGLMEQVVANLLDNAWRYAPAGSAIRVRVREGPEGQVETRVEDDGPGVAASNLAKVFDRFFTTEPKDRLQEQGTGLGLAIVKAVVEAHHGEVGVESPPGQGACFWFRLPLDRT